MMIRDAEGRPLRFSSAAAERKWARARGRSVAASGPAKDEPAIFVDARVNGMVVRALIKAAEAEIGSKIYTDDRTERFLTFARRTAMSASAVAAELGRFLAKELMREGRA
jgi:hypothetical protein